MDVFFIDFIFILTPKGKNFANQIKKNSVVFLLISRFNYNASHWPLIECSNLSRALHMIIILNLAKW